MKDRIPVDPSAELSLDNILTNIRFRAQLGLKLVNYTMASDYSYVDLEFEAIDTTPSKKS
jgi:hypothetical protein